MHARGYGLGAVPIYPITCMLNPHARTQMLESDQSEHVANELQYKKFIDHTVEAELYIEENQDKARRRISKMSVCLLIKKYKATGLTTAQTHDQRSFKISTINLSKRMILLRDYEIY